MQSCTYEVGKKQAPTHLGRVLVLGLGKTGRSVVSYLLEFPHRLTSVTVVAGAPTDVACEFAQQIADRPFVSVHFDCDRVSGNFDLGIVSPGIPEGSALYQSAKDVCTEVIGEVEFAWRESSSQSRWIAVTGTNGKTTVTTLCAHLLRKAGISACAVGNIGDTCLDAVREGKAEVYVAETSSYQLASTKDFAPNVAVLLGITPDHIHWHGTFEAYRDAKLKLLANLSRTNGAVAVLDATNEIVRREIPRLRECTDLRERSDLQASSDLQAHSDLQTSSDLRASSDLQARTKDVHGFSYVPLGAKGGIDVDMRTCCASKNAAFLDADGMLHIRIEGEAGFDGALVCKDDLQIKGTHNIINALAAAVAAFSAGADMSAIVAGLKSFMPLEHRIEPCGVLRGVSYYNDSKATNVDATLKALTAFENRPLIVLLGGDDKGTDLAPLRRALNAHARIAVCFGAASERFAAAFNGKDQAFCVMRAKNLQEAVEVAMRQAQAGDVVLLSPACASFDEFDSFESRGLAFKNLVAQYKLSCETHRVF